MMLHQKFPKLRDLGENLDLKAIGEYQALLAEMEWMVNLAPVVNLAPLVLLALAETSLHNWLMAMMRNLVAPFLLLDLWVQWVPAVLLALPVHLVLKVSKVILVSLVNQVQLVPLVHVALQVLLARMVKMVNLENLAVLVSVVPLVHRVLVVSPELLVCLA